MLSRVAGADEAGRGAVIGPLVVAAVAVDASEIDTLIELGVRDSKLLDGRSRMRLYSRIVELGECAVCVAEPRVIDRYVHNHALNILEARMFAHVLSRLKPLLAYVDACDTRPERFSAMIARVLDGGDDHGDDHGDCDCDGEYDGEDDDYDASIMISSAHKADRDNVLVAAASIVAKVTRDRMIDDMRRVYGDFGSGYPSDRRTRRFIEDLLTSGAIRSEYNSGRYYRPPGVDVIHLKDDTEEGYDGYCSATRRRFDFIRYSWRPVRALLASA
ncbi:MAG: ribonuclease HII [Candidatus Nitrosocaldus sp.]|nr:ribonuclease HII [Candidatus Nitrosocaldus sp.]